MQTSYKRFKLRTIAPFLTGFLNSLLGGRSSTNLNKHFNDPFFIIGSGRNGSTLLGGMLNSHHEIFLPPEQYILGYSLLKWNLKRHKNWDRISAEIIDDYQLSKNTCNWDTSLESLKQEICQLEKGSRNFSNLIGKIFQCIANKKNKSFKIYGDQSPITTHFCKDIAEEFPRSKFIVLIRDPRDVALSYSKINNHPARNLEYAMWKWNDSIRMLDFLKKRNPSSIMHVKYEELVENPKPIVETICSFLDVSYSDKLLDNTNSAEKLGVSKLSIHSNLKNKINTSSIGKWKEELSKEKINSINKLTKLNRERFGY